MLMLRVLAASESRRVLLGAFQRSSIINDVVSSTWINGQVLDKGDMKIELTKFC